MTESEPVVDQEDACQLIYEPNKKHKPVPIPGRHGSICPSGVDGQLLLGDSELCGQKRYATDGAFAYCAQRHLANRWHGYPVEWAEVPPVLVAKWIASGKVDRRTVRRARRRGRS